MPQAIPFALAYAASNIAAAAGATVAAQATISAAVASIATFAVPVALSVGAGLIVRALQPRPSTPSPSDIQTEFQQSVPPRMFHYGKVQVSGPLAFYETGEDDNPETSEPALFKIILISSREIESFEKWYLDDELVTVNPATNFVTTAKYISEIPRVKLTPHLGGGGQLADADLVTFFPTIWSENHRLQGIAYVLARFRAVGASRYNEVYTNGEPQVSVRIKGNKVYDPRKDGSIPGGSGAHRHDTKSTWEWSDNAALCVLDWLTYEDGYRKPINAIDLASFQAMADLCDENVPLKAGGTEKRYRVATTVYMTEARSDVLARLLEACDGRLYPNAAGKVSIRGGEWNAPTVTLSADDGHIIEAEITDGADALTRYNELAIKYLSPEHGYREVEGAAWQNEDDIAETGLIITRPFELMQVPSHGQARRLAKIKMARENPRYIGRIRTNFFGLAAVGEEVVRLEWSELDVPEGNFNGPFWIAGDEFRFLSDGTGTMAVIRSADPSSFNWNADTEEGNPPTVPSDAPAP